MRILVQRVTSARVAVSGEVVGEIHPDGQGLVALVGVTHTDDADKARRLAEKLWQLRILDDEKSASDTAAPILVVSQFTLYANTAKGRRPTWNAAAPGAVAEPLVQTFLARRQLAQRSDEKEAAAVAKAAGCLQKVSFRIGIRIGEGMEWM